MQETREEANAMEKTMRSRFNAQDLTQERGEISAALFKVILSRASKSYPHRRPWWDDGDMRIFRARKPMAAP